ncbi:MAG: serine/threonine-protein kinase HipA [Chlamydiales bacterium]|jgi:serine/threonine-protein kinase HipA
MRKAKVYVKGIYAGELVEQQRKTLYEFTYAESYQGPPVSLTMPVRKALFCFEGFPPFFEGLLPEGYELRALLQIKKINKNDYFKQLVTVGLDLVGYVTVEAIE